MILRSINSVHDGDNKLPSPMHVLALGLLFVGGFAVVFLAQVVSHAETQGIHLILTANPVKLFCVLVGIVLVAFLLYRCPEVALALFFLVGLVKGDPRLESAPMDLTLAVAGIVIVETCCLLVIGRRSLQLPREYLLYLPLLGMMVLSLAYTPDISSGFEKFLRFICLTSIGIVAPFVLFDETKRLRRFFIIMAAGGLALAIQSLATMNGDSRLVSPSGLNTELGAASAVGIIVIWGMLFPEWPLVRRFLFYPVLGVLAIALVGSGGRFANLSAGICVLMGAFFCRKLFSDLLVAGALGLAALPFVRIPQDSLEYLSSLANPSSAMGTRHDLLLLGVKTFMEHPLFGVGLQGFRWLSPNPLTYNYPHNLILELGSEMGAVAALIFVSLAYLSFRESIRQLRSPTFRGGTLVPTVFLLLVYVFLDAMISGDINDLRFMWFVFGLPYVLRQLQPDLRAEKLPVVAPVGGGLAGLNCAPSGEFR